MLITKREEVTKQGFCKILRRKLRPRSSGKSLIATYSNFNFNLIVTHMGGVGVGAYVIEFDWEEEGVRVGWGGRLLSFSAFRMGANSRWALIRGWALIQLWYLFFPKTVSVDKKIFRLKRHTVRPLLNMLKVPCIYIMWRKLSFVELSGHFATS